VQAPRFTDPPQAFCQGRDPLVAPGALQTSGKSDRGEHAKRRLRAKFVPAGVSNDTFTG